MRKQVEKPFSTALIEPWFDELDQLARRRAENRSAIDAHLDRFERALQDLQDISGRPTQTYRRRLLQRIEETLASPWPITAARRAKLLYAKDRLGRR